MRRDSFDISYDYIYKPEEKGAYMFVCMEDKLRKNVELSLLVFCLLCQTFCFSLLIPFHPLIILSCLSKKSPSKQKF